MRVKERDTMEVAASHCAGVEAEQKLCEGLTWT